MKQGLYLYCIVPGSVQGTLESDNLKFVPLQNIQTLVEEVPLEEFWGDNLKKNLTDRKWLEDKIMKHNQVISEASRKWTAIPMKFGTVFESEESLQKVLKEKEGQFKNLLKQLAGKEEWGVKVFCETDKLKAHIGRVSQSIKDIDAAMKNKTEGAAYFLKRKREEMLVEESDKKVNEYVISIHEKLVELAVRSCLNKLQPRELAKKEADMILNGAYLVLKEKLKDFKSKVFELQKTYEGSGLQLAMSGPWPPYSFVDLEEK